MEQERRYFAATELRARTGANPGLTGHAAVFNQLSEDLGGYREKIQSGAFADTIKSGDVRALWNHDPNFILARTKSGTLKLAEDNTGLKIDADLPDTTFARDLLKSIERGDVDQMSFGFMVLPEGSSWRMEEGTLVRTLLKVELFDVSPVTFPAYPQTDVSARAELRNIAQAKLKELSTESGDVFAARIKAREAFLSSRVQPRTLQDIYKKARMKAV